MNFIATPAINPISVPRDAFNAFFNPKSFNSSPERAPIKGPVIIPIGPKKNPKKSPIVAPINPFFVPPSFFNPIIGIIKSKIKTETAMVKHPMRK